MARCNKSHTRFPEFRIALRQTPPQEESGYRKLLGWEARNINVVILPRRSRCLVRATGKQRRQNHQIRQRKQPLVCLRARGFRSSRDEAQMTAAREIVQMIHADSRQACYFRVGKDFLA
jgi:hypothetical protein